MPEAASAVAAPPSTSTSTVSPGTGGGGASEDVKITYGSPEGDGNVEKIGTPDESIGEDGGGEGDGLDGSFDEFGENDADWEGDQDAPAVSPDKFSSEQYKALKQALAANPELFKAVKREISENSRYKALFESPEAA